MLTWTWNIIGSASPNSIDETNPVQALLSSVTTVPPVPDEGRVSGPYFTGMGTDAVMAKRLKDAFLNALKTSAPLPDPIADMHGLRCNGNRDLLLDLYIFEDASPGLNGGGM